MNDWRNVWFHRAPMVSHDVARWKAVLVYQQQVGLPILRNARHGELTELLRRRLGPVKFSFCFLAQKPSNVLFLALCAFDVVVPHSLTSALFTTAPGDADKFIRR